MKERLDVMMVRLGLAPSREKARAIIMAGEVLVDGQREDKPGSAFPDTVKITVRGNPIPYVSRGGLKLEKAVKAFGLKLQGRICMDVGSSTGGFTDCMLQNGAVKVYSVDVGHGQLDWKLRNDERVVCMERTNIRYVTPEDIQERPSFVSIDVSFISLTKVLPVVRALLEDGGEIVCLIKPQFEAGREKVGKKGVVRDPAVHREVIRQVSAFAAENGFRLLELEFSPVKGPEGNIEYLLHLQKRQETAAEENTENKTEDGWDRIVEGVVEAAHRALDRKPGV
jgi:23S rRNA (cytidine1920-2'-O)/16S rRNA (cytidine1409-2'-O)-methyltransferase